MSANNSPREENFSSGLEIGKRISQSKWFSKAWGFKCIKSGKEGLIVYVDWHPILRLS